MENENLFSFSSGRTLLIGIAVQTSQEEIDTEVCDEDCEKGTCHENVIVDGLPYPWHG